MTAFGRYLERGWLVLASGAVAAAALAALWVLRAPVEYLPDPDPTPQGEPAALEGMTFTLRGMATLDEIPGAAGVTTPMPGAIYVGALIDYRSTDGADASCLVYLLGDGRQWQNPRTVSTADLEYTTYCSGTSGTLLQVFEVPLTAVDEVRGLQVIGKGGKAILAGEVKRQ